VWGASAANWNRWHMRPRVIQLPHRPHSLPSHPGLKPPSYPDYNLKMVDVRDVAKVHHLAMITPSANGR
jgi:hypothetical protein